MIADVMIYHLVIVIVIIIFMIVRVYVVGKNLLIAVVFVVEMNHSVKILKQ